MKFQKIIDIRTNVQYDWMLVMESELDVLNFHEKSMPAKIQVAWENLREVQRGVAHINNPMGVYIQWGVKSGESLIFATSRLVGNLMADKAKCIHKYGKIYQNKFGGYFPHSDDIKVLEEYLIEDNTILFPSYSKSDIRVKQWEGGTHYYAYVGDIWVIDINGNNKFNSEEDAQKAASWKLWKLNQQLFEFKNK